MEFVVDDWVYMKVSPIKGVIRFIKNGKLRRWYVGAHRIAKRIRKVAYVFTVHPVYNVSTLWNFMGHCSLIIPTDISEFQDKLFYEKIPVQILYYKVCKFRLKEVAAVKVLWRNQFVEEATWEAEEDMKNRYPHLLESRENASQGTNFLLSTI